MAVGVIEFGECCDEAVVREIREEFALEVRQRPTAGAGLENVFAYFYEPGHCRSTLIY